MTNVWEANIKEWYDKSRTANLSYLDLATTEKPTNKELAHNISVIYDRVCLSSKVNLKEFRENQLLLQNLEKQNKILTQKVQKLEKEVQSLTQHLIENQPLTKGEVRDLVREIALQPKLVEEQALRISQDLQNKIGQVEILLQHLKANLIG